MTAFNYEYGAEKGGERRWHETKREVKQKEGGKGLFGILENEKVVMGFGQLSKVTKTLCVIRGGKCINNNLDCPTNVVIVRLNK